MHVRAYGDLCGRCGARQFTCLLRDHSSLYVHNEEIDLTYGRRQYTCAYPLLNPMLCHHIENMIKPASLSRLVSIGKVALCCILVEDLFLLLGDLRSHMPIKGMNFGSMVGLIRGLEGPESRVSAPMYIRAGLHLS